MYVRKYSIPLPATDTTLYFLRLLLLFAGIRERRRTLHRRLKAALTAGLVILFTAMPGIPQAAVGALNPARAIPAIASLFPSHWSLVAAITLTLTLIILLIASNETHADRWNLLCVATVGFFISMAWPLILMAAYLAAECACALWLTYHFFLAINAALNDLERILARAKHSKTAGDPQ